MPRDDVGYPQQLRELLRSDRIADLPAAIHDAFTVLRTNHTGKNDEAEDIAQFYALLGELVTKTKQEALTSILQVLLEESAETELLLTSTSQHHRELLSLLLTRVPSSSVFSVLASLLQRPEPSKHLSAYHSCHSL